MRAKSRESRRDDGRANVTVDWPSIESGDASAPDGTIVTISGWVVPVTTDAPRLPISCPRLAASLEAVMMGTFVCLVHMPGVAADPGSRLQWTMLFIALALTGSAWAVADALADHPRGLANLRHAGVAQR